MELVTKTELARKIGVSQPYITKKIKDGTLKKCLDGKKLKLECAIKALNANIKDFKRANQFETKDKELIKKYAPQKELVTDENVGNLKILLAGVENPSQKVAIIKDYWTGKINQIKYEAEKGKYILKSEVENQASKTATILREKLFNIPNKISPLCYGKTIAEIQEIIYSAINEAVQEVNDAL